MQEWEETVQGGSYLMNETTPSLPIVETLWDDVLLSCLEPGGERMTLFKIEDTFIHFLKSKEQQLVIEQLPSYHRLLVHRYADRCGVERKQNDQHAAEASSTLRNILLYKTDKSIIPKNLYIDRQQKQQEGQQPRPMIRVKQRATAKKQDAANAVTNIATPCQKNKTVADREKAYAEARARIFGKEEKKPPTTKGPSVVGFSAGRGKPKESKPAAVIIRAPSSRATLRNREAEMQDPEFTRHAPQYDNRYTRQPPAYMYPPPRQYGYVPPLPQVPSLKPPQDTSNYQDEFPPLG